MFNSEIIYPLYAKYPVVHRFVGKFMQLPDHVNAYIVELENYVIVVDSTLAWSSAKELRRQAESFGKPIKAVLVTHGHPDHYTGLVEFGDVPRFGSQGCLEFAHREDIVKSPTASGYLGDDYPKERLFPNEIVKNGDTLIFDGVTFTFRDMGPGESDSDGIWQFRKDGVTHAFVGDLVSLNCHNFYHDGHVFEWQQILQGLKQEFSGQSVRLYIGHGEAPAGIQAVDWQIGYNNAFINSISALEDRSIPVSQTSQDNVLTAMKTYLPSDATLFLLQYGLGDCIANVIERRRFIPGKGKDYYREQLLLMSSGRIDELVEKHYHHDAVMVTFDGIRRGHNELKKYFVDTLAVMKKITGMSTEYFAETEDSVIFRATITSEGRGTVNAVNGLYLSNGKIYRHLALTLLPDVDYPGMGTQWTA
jgi:glyoxylase-like metal-dependent hydrolase (beta-lactamase superfamily II)